MSSQVEELIKREFHSSNESGWNRVKRLYSDIWVGEERAEKDAVLFMTASSGVFGGLIGGLMNTWKVQENFIRRHNHRVFHGKTDAKKQYIDFLIRYVGKETLQHGTKCALFTFTLGTSLLSLAVYRNDLRISDAAVATGTVAMSTRMHMGTKAMFASFIIGAVIGTITSSAAKLTLWASNTTVEDLLNWGNRDRYFQMMAEKQKAMVKNNLKIGEENPFVLESLELRQKALDRSLQQNQKVIKS